MCRHGPSAGQAGREPDHRLRAVPPADRLACGRARRRPKKPTAPALSGDGGLTSAAQLNGPYNVTDDADGNLLIAEIGVQTHRGPGRSVFLGNCNPSGGTVTQIDAANPVLPAAALRFPPRPK